MIDDIKHKAITGASKIAMSPPVLKMLSNPNVQKAFLTMMNANADFREWMDAQIKSVARNVSLATTEDLGRLRRQLREASSDVATLTDRVSSLETELQAYQKAATKKPAVRKTTKRASSTKSKKSKKS